MVLLVLKRNGIKYDSSSAHVTQHTLSITVHREGNDRKDTMI